MTVPVNAVKKTVVCDGQTRTWQFNFPLASQETIEVWVKPAQGTPYKVTDHVVLDRESDASYTYVTYPALSSGLSPLAAGVQLVFVRVTPLTQEVVFGTHVLPQTFTQAFDKTVLQLQNLDEKISRCVRYDPDPTLSASDTNATTFLSSVLTQAQNTVQTAVAAVSEELQTQVSEQGQSLTALQSAVAGKQDAGNYVTESSLATSLAAKQNTLSSAQLAAVNSGVDADTVAQVQTNRAGISALDAELAQTRAWQKPSSWIDLRAGALPGSVYYLVAHSADYTSYPSFDVYATVSNSGTYDVYVDGVKKASAVTSGTVTTLTWSTLALTTGYDITYPAALKTHIVRVAPTLSTNVLTRIGADSSTVNHGGILWIHFTVNSALDIRYLALNATNLEAVTSNGEKLLVSNAYNAFTSAAALKEIPVLDGNNNSVSLYNTFHDASSLKQITLANLTANSGVSTFKGASALTQIICRNAYILCGNSTFQDCAQLSVLPPMDATSSTTAQTLLKGCTSLSGTVADFQAATGLTKLDASGTSSARIDGLKGLLVSSSAPFSGASPQLNASYTGLNKAALVSLFNSLPTVENSQVCNITGAAGANDLTADDLAIATAKGWTVTR